MELNEMEKKLLFQVEGDYQTKILNELYMTVRYSNNSEQREAAEGLMAKLRVLSNAECMDLVKDIQKNYRLPYPARTIGEKIAEARQQSGAEKLKGHDIMALERFDPEVKHMIVFDLGKLVIIFLGELDGLLYALVIFVVLDYITGICAAIQAKHLSSNIGAKGIAKKVAIFLVISVAHVADQYLVDSTDVLRSMTTLFYLSNEGISIFENIGKIGIPLPGKLNNLLSRFEDIKNQMK